MLWAKPQVYRLWLGATSSRYIEPLNAFILKRSLRTKLKINGLMNGDMYQPNFTWRTRTIFPFAATSCVTGCGGEWLIWRRPKMGRFSEARAAFRTAVVEEGSSIIICHKKWCSMQTFWLKLSRLVKGVTSYFFLVARPYGSMASHFLVCMFPKSLNFLQKSLICRFFFQKSLSSLFWSALAKTRKVVDAQSFATFHRPERLGFLNFPPNFISSEPGKERAPFCFGSKRKVKW